MDDKRLFKLKYDKGENGKIRKFGVLAMGCQGAISYTNISYN